MSDGQIRDAYRDASRPRSRANCPPAQSLVDFAAGSRHDSSIADHIGDCTACAEEFQALRAVAPQIASPAPRARTSLWQIAAAALLVISLYLAVENRKLRSGEQAIPPAPSPAGEITPAPPGRPAVTNLAIVDLLPRSAMTRGGAAAVPTAPAGDQLALILNLDGGKPYPDYAVDIVDPGGKVLSSTSGLTRSPNDTFAILVARPAADRCELRLYGVRDGTRELMESYTLGLR